MSARCPAGHETASTDYCDVCGLPVAAGGAPGAASLPSPAAVAAGASGGAAGAAVLPPPLPASTDKPCPHCGTDNVADALFCENCGYDFTTGAAPREEEPDAVPDAAVPDAAVPDAAGGAATPQAEGSAPGPDADGAGEAPAEAPAPQPPATAGPPSPAPSVDPRWVAEVWVDPDWYDAQGSADPCPSAGPPAVVLLTERSILIGRTSATRNIHPQIDISSDPGVSRRHAQLSTDGMRWFVEDLQSANGTYVAVAGAPLPETPLDPGARHELDDDERLYLGAWTRIVLRPATDDELA